MPDRKTFLHYTSLTAFYAIMETATLRFTSAGNTNDPSEIIFGQDIVESALDQLVDEETGKRRAAVKSVMTFLNRDILNPFVFCTSQPPPHAYRDGELSQWRLYGANGRGVALVISADHRVPFSTLQRFLGIPRKVIYGREAGIEVVKAELRHFLNQMTSLGYDQSPSDINMLGEFGGNRISWLPSIMKHESYMHEQEVRFVYRNSETVHQKVKQATKFIESGGILKPVVDLSFAAPHDPGSATTRYSFISDVIIGPSGDQSAISDSIQHYLAANGWSIRVKQSGLPYRSP